MKVRIRRTKMEEKNTLRMKCTMMRMRISWKVKGKSIPRLRLIIDTTTLIFWMVCLKMGILGPMRHQSLRVHGAGNKLGRLEVVALEALGAMTTSWPPFTVVLPIDPRSVQ